MESSNIADGRKSKGAVQNERLFIGRRESEEVTIGNKKKKKNRLVIIRLLSFKEWQESIREII